MAGAIQVADKFILFGAARGIVHIPQVVFPLDVVLVVADELVFVGEFEEDGEEAEEFRNDFGVAFAAEGFDFGDVAG
jgi:hypothetical protein